MTRKGSEKNLVPDAVTSVLGNKSSNTNIIVTNILKDLQKGLTMKEDMVVDDGTVVEHARSEIMNKSNGTIASMISELNGAIQTGRIDATSGADLFVKYCNKYKYNEQQERFALLKENDDDDDAFDADAAIDVD